MWLKTLRWKRRSQSYRTQEPSAMENLLVLGGAGYDELGPPRLPTIEARLSRRQWTKSVKQEVQCCCQLARGCHRMSDFWEDWRITTNPGEMEDELFQQLQGHPGGNLGHLKSQQWLVCRKFFPHFQGTKTSTGKRMSGHKKPHLSPKLPFTQNVQTVQWLGSIALEDKVPLRHSLTSWTAIKWLGSWSCENPTTQKGGLWEKSLLGFLRLGRQFLGQVIYNLLWQTSLQVPRIQGTWKPKRETRANDSIFNFWVFYENALGYVDINELSPIVSGSWCCYMGMFRRCGPAGGSMSLLVGF